MPALIRALSVLTPVALLLWLAWPTVTAITAVWLDDGTYSHGSLLLATCAWLVWHERRNQPWPAPRPWWPGMAVLALGATAYLLSLLSAIDLLQRLLLLPLLLSAVATVSGLPRARRLLFPALLLSLALPVWGLLIPALQSLAVLMVGGLLDWQEIPARIHATYIRIPAGDFEVAQGCSGLRYLLVAAAITLLWGRLYLRHWWHTLAYLAIGIVAALVTNWIRIYLLIRIGHETEMQHPLMSDHNNFGWYIFAVMLVPLFWIGRKLPHRADTPVTASNSRTAQPLWLASACASAIVIGMGVAFPADKTSSAPAFVLHPPLPAPPTSLARPAADSWTPVYNGLDREWQLAYRHPDVPYTLYLGWYAQQRNGAELDAAGNTLAPAPWQVTGRPAACPQQARCLLVSDGRRKRLVLYWHWTNGTWIRSRLAGKWQQLRSRLGGTPDAALIAISAACNDNCDTLTEPLWRAARDTFDDVAAQLAARQAHDAQ
ncbi:MAG: EpsI family protein [Alcanivoracaceae bacterium]|nr:EpsI family protein [Alcanivoracaceae bacterium]